MKTAPILLAADMNEEANHPCWKQLSAIGLVDAAGGDATPTFPALGTRTRIDAIHVSPSLTVQRYAVGKAALPDGFDVSLLGKATDHLPVLVELDVEPGY